MIIEGLLVTERDDGSPHVAPMGPVVNAELTQWTLRPFQSSMTFAMLRARPTCIFHVVDDVLPVAQAALGLPVELEFQAHPTSGWIIASACHWYQLAIQQWNVSAPRSEAQAIVTNQGTLRPFWGWNRAKHAVLEAAILATRVHLLQREVLQSDLARLSSAVDKTAGPRERQAWDLVVAYIRRECDTTLPDGLARDGLTPKLTEVAQPAKPVSGTARKQTL
ncbi:MAG: DUF447 family protein [Pirellulaceae bacterium]